MLLPTPANGPEYRPPGRHSTSEINFCIPAKIEARDEICGEIRDKDSNENFGILMIYMKSGKLEI